MTLNELAISSYDNAKNKGFYDEIEDLMNHPHLTSKQKTFIRNLWLSNRLMLIVSELGEALEGLRHWNMSSEPASGGFGEELADAQIRIADLSTDIGLDLEKAVEAKAAYNKNRPFKHNKTT